MPIFLIRHPRPIIAAGVCYGQLDVDCEDPAPIAARLRAQLPAGAPVISSPLRRARRLAEALDPTATCDERLREIHFGEWEGRPWDAIDRGLIDAWAIDVRNFKPPGGESVAMLQTRAIAFAQDLAAANVVLVAHAGILRALVGYWQKLPFETWSQLNFEFGGLTSLHLPDEN